jgi:putative MATE family efflux protein
MQDLTRGSITTHILSMAAPLAAGMIFQTLYYFVDLYFVAQLGDAAIAGVSAAGNATFIVFALTQTLGVGSVALISQAAGRKDHDEANLVFNQSVGLSVVCGVATLIACFALAAPYMHTVTSHAETAVEGAAYLRWFGPGLALQFALVVMASALRGTGIVKPAMLVQVQTLILNALLAPVFIAGWGTGHPLGVAGAGLASSVAIAVGVGLLLWYFVRLERYVVFRAEYLRPRLEAWKRILKIGLPVGGEFALIFLYNAITYWAIRSFGPTAQAGFGVGSRVMQGVFVPALALAFTAAPIAGQNFGARNAARVRETFRRTAWMTSLVMLLLTALCQWDPQLLVRPFSSDAEVVRVGGLFLRIFSWNFVTQGIIFTCSNMFQGLGNTLPSIMSSGTRLFTYALPAIWLSMQPFFEIEYIWYWAVVTTSLQALISLGLLRQQFRTRLEPSQSARTSAQALRLSRAADGMLAPVNPVETKLPQNRHET